MASSRPSSTPRVNKAQYKNVVDQALTYLREPLAVKIVEVLREMCGDDWWERKVEEDDSLRGKLKPKSPEDSDRIKALEISSCCELVFNDILHFSSEKVWGRRCRGLINLVREARNRSSHRTVGEPDLTAEDAEYYLYAIHQTAKMIKADIETVDMLEWQHECLWLGRVPEYSQLDVHTRSPESANRDLVPFKTADRWSDAEDLRDEVGRHIGDIGDDAVMDEIERRIGDETRLAEVGWGNWVCTYRDCRDVVVDEPCVTLVFLLHNAVPLGEDVAVDVTEVADRIMADAGGKARVNRNMLLFVFSEPGPVRTLKSSIRVYLALNDAIREGSGGPQAGEFLKDADQECRRRVRLAFSNLLVPEPGWGVRQSRYRRLRLDGYGNILESAFDAAASEGLVYVAEAVGSVGERRFSLQDVGWPNNTGNVEFIRIKELWERLCSVVNCPKLESCDVLLHAVWREVLEGRYGYAEDVQVFYSDKPRPGWYFMPGTKGQYPYPKCTGLRFEQDVHDISAEGFIVNLDVVALNGGIVFRHGVGLPRGDPSRLPGAKLEGGSSDE